jgi:pyridoxamine 5'-phosphate oxidase
MNSLSDMRKNYSRGRLDRADSAVDPVGQFAQWLDAAVQSGIPEPNAMTLATCSPQSRPSTRIVLLKDFGPTGLTWFTNYESRKGAELAANPHAALQFHWVELERVVRIEGTVDIIPAQESDAYYLTRPLQSRIGAWASPQSSQISGRSVLVANAAAYAAKYLLNPPRPPHWGGYRLQPDYWEFWQGRESRLHDRIAYRKLADGKWEKVRLAP